MTGESSLHHSVHYFGQFNGTTVFEVAKSAVFFESARWVQERERRKGGEKERMKREAKEEREKRERERKKERKDQVYLST